MTRPPSPFAAAVREACALTAELAALQADVEALSARCAALDAGPDARPVTRPVAV